MVLNTVGFDIVYPDGCAEIDESLRPDELRKRINDINAALRDMLRQSGIKDDSVADDSVNQHSVTQTQKPIQNLSIWAWSDEETVRQFILNSLVTLIHQSSALLTNDVVAYLLSFLIEPAKSSQPTQHALVKDLIVRAAAQLEYPIQMLIQNSLVLSDQKYASTDLDESEAGVRPHDPLGEHSFIVIYALHTLQESLVSPILPCVELKLKSSVARERKRAFRLLARIFSESNSTVHHKNPELWTTFLSRFNDIDADVRNFCIQMVPVMLRQNAELPRDKLVDCLKSCTIDRTESVRLLALRMIATLMHEAKGDEADSLFDIIYNRSRDRSLSVRKEVLSELALVYKQNLQAAEPNLDKMVMTLNSIMHMYYQPSVDDKIIVERLFKSCIVPYNFDTKERVKSLFTCYQLADDASIKAIQELLKVQFVGSAIVREALRVIVDHQGKRILGRASAEMVRIIQKLSSLLPKAEKAIDHLKKFFNAVHSDRPLRTSCCQLFHPNCSSKMAAQCMHDLLKRIASQLGGGGGEVAQYEHTVKLLVERCASVLFDEAFGQELLTRLVVSMETGSSQNSLKEEVVGQELVRDLRILLALSVYHKDTLPADDMFQYINSVLDAHQSTLVPDVPVESPSTEDPSSPVELCLQVLCCLLGGGPIYGPKDAGGSGVALEQHVSSFQASLEDAGASASTEGEKRHKGVKFAAKRSRGVSLFYSGSGEQLCEQTHQILPLLAAFCTSGLTAAYPPVSIADSHKSTPPTKAKRQRRGEKESAMDEAVEEVVTVGQAGLAWRREKRRAKLSVRVLRQLLSVVHALAGKHSTFPKGPVSFLDTTRQESDVNEEDDDEEEEEEIENKTKTTTTAEGDGTVLAEGENDLDSVCSEAPRMANLEVKIQQTLDEIVKTCLACDIASSDYITCLTTLSHVGLLFPGVYNRQLKPLMTGHLIPNLLTKDGDTEAPTTKAARRGGRRQKARTVTEDDGKEGAQPSDWTVDGNLPLLTRAKIAAVKLMANWLVGLKLQNKQVAQIIIRLIHRIIVHDGDLTCSGLMSLGDMSRMRLVAATSWLKIAHFQFYAEVIEVGWYQSMSYVMCDPCSNVRSHFLGVLHQGLIQLKLPLEYMAMFAHAADVSELAFRQRAKQYLAANVKQRREFLAKHGPFNENPKLLFALLPDFVLAYTIHLLAHDPDWEKPDDVARLSVVKSALWFVMEPIMAGGNNYTFLRQLLEKIKHSQDALRPTDENSNTKIYIACDISLGLLLTRCTNIVWKGCQFEIKLPRTLFLRAPSSFSNPDFAQLCRGEGGSPLVTFTPCKNAKAVKDGLIPPQFLRVKNPANKHRSQQPQHSSVGDNSEIVDEGESTKEEIEMEGAPANEMNSDGDAGDVDLETSPGHIESASGEELSGKKRRKKDAGVAANVISKRVKKAKQKEGKEGGNLKQTKLPFAAKSKTTGGRPNTRITKPSASSGIGDGSFGSFIRFRPITFEGDASHSSFHDDRTSLSDSSRNIDLDREDSAVGGTVTTTSLLGNPQGIISKTDTIRRLLRPVREKHSSKEAEEVRITQLYEHALQISSGSESSVEAIPLLESIVHSFLLRSAPAMPAHLKTIKFASCKHLANLYLKSENLEAALKWFKLAVELDETDLGLWLKLASTAITLHRFDLATPALTHVLKEQPSHPLALYWALPYFFAISEFEACISYSVRCLFIDPYNQAAIHCIRRALALRPSLDFLLEKLLERHPDILSHGVVSEEAETMTDQRIAKIRGGYVRMSDEFKNADEIKTVKFPEPLTKLSWEHLARAFVNMFDRLNKEGAINSMLDLRSLFEGCHIPSKQHSQEAEAVAFADIIIIDVDSEASFQPLSSDTCGDSYQQPSQPRDQLHLDFTETQQTPASVRGEEDERRRISKRIRRSTVMFDDISQTLHGLSCMITTTPSAHNPHAANAGTSAAVVAASTPCAGSLFPTTAADAQPTRWLWVEKATRFASLLPFCFRDLALLSEKTQSTNAKKDMMFEKLMPESHLAKGREDEVVAPSDVVLESGLVTEFLRILSDDKPNAVLLGVALLLQMSAHIKPWTQSFSAAYLAVSARVRPCLPLWRPNTLSKEVRPPTEELVLPTDLLRLRRCPSLWHLANLHTAYAEVRLDALVVCRKAADSAKRHLTSFAASSRSAGVVDSEDPELRALSQALQFDSARFLGPDETISISDFNKVMELVSLFPEEAPESIVFHGRILWINYELSVVAHKYDAMKDYLLQMKEFVTRHGSLRRSCSFRNSYITLDRIDELLAQVEDASMGERLQHLCKAEQDTAKLMKALKDCLHSHFVAPCKGKRLLLHFGTHAEGLPRICQMLYQPLNTLNMRLLQSNSDSESAREAVLLALRCWRMATQALALVAVRCVKGEQLSSLPTLPLSEQETAGLEDVWRAVTVAYDLLQTCWGIIGSEMSFDSKAKAFARRLTPELLCSKSIFTFKQLGDKVLILTFGHFCQTLCLIIDTFAWRLLATGALGLPVPELSYEFVTFLYETIERLESCFPIHLLHSNLAIYRALYSLGRSDIDRRAASSLLAFLRDYPSSCLLRCARGRDIAPPSLLLLHLFHDLLPLTSTVHCSSSSTPLGLRYLRCVAVTVASTLQCLSEGYHRLRASRSTGADDEEEVGAAHQSMEKMEVEAETTNASPQDWSSGSFRVGEILAQAMHCLCGLPTRPCVSTSTTTNATTTSDPSKVSSLLSSSSSLNSSRFKQTAAPPEPAYKSNEIEEEVEVIEVPRFTALPSAITPMPPSCVAPRPPIWLTDRAFFYESVKEHVIDLSGPSTNLGVWWLGARPSVLDWQLIEIAFVFYRPAVIPEYDSIKSLSISSELANWLKEAVKLMPKSYEEFMIPEGRIDSCMTMHTPLPEQTHYLSDMLNLVYYLLADYYTKNNNFDLAIRYYKQDLRVAPHHADSWAALALIYSSHLEQILNVIDPKTERVTSRAVASCLRCFELALQLQPRLTTLLTERGCLAYQLHSYAARLIKKSISRPFQETHLRVCMQWRRRMLTLAYRSYGQALRLERRRSTSPEVTQKEVQLPPLAADEAAVAGPSPLSISSASPSAVSGGGGEASPVTSTPVDEEWLYHYMLTKCEEKAGPGALFREESGKKHYLRETRSDWVMRVLNNYQRTADVLRAAGAKYPKKIIVYNKLPHLAVEAIEVFYRTHAFILKILLASGEPEPSAPSPLPLRQICEALYSLTLSAFVTEPSKASAKIRSRKRPSLLPEPAAKMPRLENTIGGSGGVPDTVEASGTSPPQSDPEIAVEVVSRPSFGSISNFGRFKHGKLINSLELWKMCVEYCREALELVLRRLPLHYKSMYRLAHLYLNQPSMQDLDKAMAILMGPFDHVTKVEYGGLFKDRRQSNFFHGVWRIPTADIDRSGSFAAHMYRSTLMVLEVLNKRGDWNRMLQVFHQLRKQPPEDKRGFLSEGDRVFLARRAFSLIHPTLRLWLSRQQKRAQQQETSGEWDGVGVETLRQIYRLHSFAQSRASAAAAAAAAASASQAPVSPQQPRAHSSVECVEAEEERTEEARATDVAPCFAELLAQAYELCPAAWDSAGPNLSKDLILKRCSELTSTPSAFNTSQMKSSSSTSRLTDAVAAPQTIL
ncbi:hypothetical protein TcWFU_010486 [Taenia crassiceps]|uniref:Uncharacterized protein n=1 Tax=Taenia crassiceps TaxID=6207 RepID=A0ABR4QN22_9CEST